MAIPQNKRSFGRNAQTDYTPFREGAYRAPMPPPSDMGTMGPPPGDIEMSPYGQPGFAYPPPSPAAGNTGSPNGSSFGWTRDAYGWDEGPGSSYREMIQGLGKHFQVAINRTTLEYPGLPDQHAVYYNIATPILYAKNTGPEYPERSNPYLGPIGDLEVLDTSNISRGR